MVIKLGRSILRPSKVLEAGAAAEHQVVVLEVRLRFWPESGAEMGDEQRWMGPHPKEGDGLLIQECRIFKEHHIGPRLPNGLVHISQSSTGIGPGAPFVGTGR